MPTPLLPQLNREYVIHFLNALLQTPSPSGFCMEIMKLIREETEKLGFTLEMTPKGNAIITLPGKDSKDVIALTAHVDTLGAMVRSIKPSGMIRFTPIGGYAMHTVEGEYCLIHTRGGKTYEGTVLSTKPSVHVYSDVRDWKREEENMEIRVDEGTKTKEETEKLGISAGDFISWEPRARILPNGWIKSRHLDDKASVAALFGLMEWLNREGKTPAKTVKVILSTYEEVGHGSSYYRPRYPSLLQSIWERSVTILPRRSRMFLSAPKTPPGLMTST